MSKVVGVFFDESAAQAMAMELRAKGFEGNISLVAKKQEHTEQEAAGESEDALHLSNQTLADGTATGGFIGGLAGMSIGVGSLIIPGLGPLVALGPISGFLSGALSGGIVGALIDFGIPESEGQQYEQHVRAGAILAIVTTDRQKTDEVTDLMQAHGAIDVRTHLEH